MSHTMSYCQSSKHAVLLPNILPKLVLMESHILLDKVTELVEESYHMSQGKKEQQVKPKPGEWKKFRDYSTCEYYDHIQTHRTKGKYAGIFVEKYFSAGLHKFRGASLVFRLSCVFVYVEDELVIDHLRGAKSLSGEGGELPPFPPPP